MKTIVVSSTDLENWKFETEIDINTDMREPRFFVHNDSLFMYFFEGGHKMMRFQPRKIHYVSSDKAGNWSIIYTLDGYEGFVPWRIKSHQDTLYFSTYFGEGEYSYVEGTKIPFHLRKGIDGRNWTTLSSEPQIEWFGPSSEHAFEFDEEGNIWGVCRLEMEGSLTFFGDKDSLHIWKQNYSEYKYDSPLVFRDGENIFLVARRNLYKDGKFVQFPDKPRKNLRKYSFTKKKTAIWRLDKATLTWIHIKDFESTGDTAFPGIAKIGQGKYVLMNYSSDITKKEKSWIKGQLGKTYIYYTELTITDCN